jgi:2-polyprenyl-6-hydroxyphenyl methylase/3-demethylubiquinone-9 3-methyltransferase
MANSTINKSEIEKFTNLANEWWKYDGKFKTLHKFNPVRLEFIISQIKKNFNISNIEGKPLSGLTILDIGCGGGLMCEPLARLGAEVTGIDAVEKNIKSAQIHADQNDLNISYMLSAVEELPTNNKYDIILNLEVIEHVNNQKLFISKSCELVNHGGLMFVATINKTIFSIVFAKYLAEYVLGFLPKGTHDWRKFLPPEDVYAMMLKNNFEIVKSVGINYNVLSDKWVKSKRMEANYIVSAKKN